jgi:hypothetical protein
VIRCTSSYSSISNLKRAKVTINIYFTDSCSDTSLLFNCRVPRDGRQIDPANGTVSDCLPDMQRNLKTSEIVTILWRRWQIRHFGIHPSAWVMHGQGEKNDGAVRVSQLCFQEALLFPKN